MPIGRAANGWIFRSTPPDCNVGGHFSLRRAVFFLALVFAATAAGAAQSPAAALEAIPHKHIAAVVTPAESALVGTIERFEEAARSLVLRTKDALVQFVVAPDAVVRLGSRTLPINDLASHRGRKAKVRYTQADGRRTAHWVVISSDPPHKDTSKPESTR
jgi:hypothetical protein